MYLYDKFTSSSPCNFTCRDEKREISAPYRLLTKEIIPVWFPCYSTILHALIWVCTMIRIPCLRGPVVCSVSLSLSFSYSHSTPFSMTEWVSGYSLSPFKKNSPEATFFTAGRGREIYTDRTWTTEFIKIIQYIHSQRRNKVKYLKCATLLSALGSVNVLPLWGFQELWGNLKFITDLVYVSNIIKCSFYSFLTKSLGWSRRELLLISNKHPCSLVKVPDFFHPK